MQPSLRRLDAKPLLDFTLLSIMNVSLLTGSKNCLPAAFRVFYVAALVCPGSKLARKQ